MYESAENYAEGEKNDGEHLFVRHAESGKQKARELLKDPTNLIASQVHLCVCV